MTVPVERQLVVVRDCERDITATGFDDGAEASSWGCVNPTALEAGVYGFGDRQMAAHYQQLRPSWPPHGEVANL